MENSKGIDGSLSSSIRGDARQAVAAKWADRRQRSPHLSKNKESHSKETSSVFPPLCVLLQRSWKETIQSFQSQKTIPKKKRTSFPSVLSVLHANAMRRQVESLQSTAPRLLSVLPDYNFSQAIVQMSTSRSRVFWLLDLAAIVDATIHCRKTCKGVVRLTYRTHHNANPTLLRLLNELGVSLQVSTTYEYRQAPCKVQDDPNVLSKPNSFYRQFLEGNSGPIAVDGPEEVLRLRSVIQRMAQRRVIPPVEFILKLQSRDTWFEQYQRTLEVCDTLVGLAVELPSQADPDFLEQLTRLLQRAPSLQLHLCNPNSTLDPSVVDWLQEAHPYCDSIHLDVSHLLVANASALCTRIIGVRQTEAHKIDYYIDDGCYGSLATTTSHRPLPLRSMQESDTGPLLSATVWGPTCDGLDKVCSDTPLPRLGRDDWLVFELGFCHEGTGFNGFAPPDIAYCVLDSGNKQSGLF